MEGEELVKQAIDRGIRDDFALRTLLMAMITARGYNYMQMELYKANLSLNNGNRPEQLDTSLYSDIYG